MLAPEEEIFYDGEEELIVPDETFQEIEEIMDEEMDLLTFDDPGKCERRYKTRGKERLLVPDSNNPLRLRIWQNYWLWAPLYSYKVRVT